MSQDEIKKLTQAKKQKEREKKDLEQMNRKHLANMRVVQKNLVYVVGMDPKLAREEVCAKIKAFFMIDADECPSSFQPCAQMSTLVSTDGFPRFSSPRGQQHPSL